jgi:hypothetical protein
MELRSEPKELHYEPKELRSEPKEMAPSLWSLCSSVNH